MAAHIAARVIRATGSRGRLAAALGCSAVAVALWLLRSRWAAGGLAFFLWNLFLAWIPWLLGLAAARARSRLALGLLLPAWLLFLPNAPYLVTDLIHLAHLARLARHGPVPLWYDAIVFSAFAAAGCVLGVTSLSMVRERLASEVREVWAEVVVAAAALLAGFGIYLGRFGRWNSWDAWLRPGELLEGAAASVHPRALAFSLAFGLFLWTGYLVVERVRAAVAGHGE